MIPTDGSFAFLAAFAGLVSSWQRTVATYAAVTGASPGLEPQSTLGRAAGAAWAAARRGETAAPEARKLLEEARAGGHAGVRANAEKLSGYLDMLASGKIGARAAEELVGKLARDPDFHARLAPEGPPPWPPEAERAMARVLADPDHAACTFADDNEARLAVARALAPADPTRAALIRLQVELYTAAWTPTRSAEQQLAAELARWHGPRWSPVGDLVEAAEYRRGFVGHVTLDARAFLAGAAELYRRAPITGVTLTGAAAVIAELAASPHLDRLRQLGLPAQGIGDAEVERLCASPHLGRLVELDLSRNGLTARGLDALARARASLPRLALADLSGNPEDPTPVAVADASGTPTGENLLPPAGRALVARQGPQPWLRGPLGGQAADPW